MTAPAPRLPRGSITDIDGLAVGHHQRTGRNWQTGTTVIYAPRGATPGVSVRGGGPGTRETDALLPQNLVETIHAVCLTGGSAYGLNAASGVVATLEERGLGFPISQDTGPVGVVPVVPAAVIFDLGRGGGFANRPDAMFGARALAAARDDQHRWGAVGAGTGAVAGGLQGGVGTAGAVVELPDPEGGSSSDVVKVSVGAIAVVNSNGSVIDPASGLPWASGHLPLRRPTPAERKRLIGALGGHTSSLNTTIGVVATSARLSKSEVTKMADVSHDGLARAIRPAHSIFDGDTIFGLATGEIDVGTAPASLGSETGRQQALNVILAAAADCFATACAHAVVAAVRRGAQPTYSELCPSAIG